MRVEAVGQLALGTLDLGLFHRWGDRPDNALSYLVLQIEDVVETAIKSICPKMYATSSLDELPRDAHSVCNPANASFQHIAHPEFSSHLLHVDGAPFVCEAGMAGDHEQRFEPRERRRDLLNHSVGEILLLGIAAHVLERQHRDGRLVREWRGGTQTIAQPAMRSRNGIGADRLGNVLEVLFAP